MTLFKEKINSTNRREKAWKNGRLVFFQNLPDANYWDNYWNDTITKEYYETYEEGQLNEFSGIFDKYLKVTDSILEAGCGNARYIIALCAKGFNKIDGIEWGEKTVEKVKKIYPDLSIQVGDVTNTGKPDSSYDAYISLGVVEHRLEGPEPFLIEANRVLKPSGYAFITVPYVNPLRTLKAKLGQYADVTPNASFFQYAFRRAEFRNFLHQAGFEVIEAHGIAGYYGLLEEIPGWLNFIDGLPGGWAIKQYLKRAAWIDIFGHMIIFVCKKCEINRYHLSSNS